MRAISAFVNLSLDGVMESPENWAPKFETPDLYEHLGKQMRNPTAMLFGRVTFEKFAAFWPTSDIEPFASHMREAEKYVVSTTLETAQWGRDHEVPVLNGDFVASISALKSSSESDITVLGSGALVRSLIRHHLLDQLTLAVYPVVQGQGKRLFKDGPTSELSLLESHSFKGGVVHLTYHPETIGSA
jgi:dihydrofolate reductase